MLIHRLKSESDPLPSFKSRIRTTKPNQLPAPNLTSPPIDFPLTPVFLSYRRNTDSPSGSGTGPTHQPTHQPTLQPTLQPTHQPHAPAPKTSKTQDPPRRSPATPHSTKRQRDRAGASIGTSTPCSPSRDSAKAEPAPTFPASAGPIPRSPRTDPTLQPHAPAPKTFKTQDQPNDLKLP